MTLRRAVVLVAVALLAVTLTGCGSTGASSGSSDNSPPGGQDQVSSEPSATPVAEGPIEVGRGDSAGDFAIAQASGIAKSPKQIKVQVEASPPQAATVSWNLACADFDGTGTKDGHETVNAPTEFPLELPFEGASECIVAANAQLQSSGTVAVILTAE